MSLERDIEEYQEQLHAIFHDQSQCAGRDWQKSMMNLYSESVWVLGNRIGSLSKGRILEIGCGKAKALTNLKGSHPQLDCYGIDINLNRYKIKGNEELHLSEQDACHLDFPSDYFDIIYSIMVFPYIPDKLQALREAHRVLSPGGLAFITLRPEYFSPHGCTLIPETQGNSDITWFCGDEIKIKKQGLGVPFNDWTLAGISPPQEHCISDAIHSTYQKSI